MGELFCVGISIGVGIGVGVGVGVSASASDWNGWCLAEPLPVTHAVFAGLNVGFMLLKSRQLVYMVLGIDVVFSLLGFQFAWLSVCLAIFA